MAIKYYYDIEQGTDAWYDARLGLITASNINTLLTPKGKPATGQKVKMYAYELAAQRTRWLVDNTFQSFDMERGHIQEGIARNYYSDAFEDVRECGFITNTDLGFKWGASPDGLVGEDGGIEIKSRLSKFQIKTVCEDEVPDEYMNQIQATMLVSGRKWIDFVSYSNGLPLYVKRVFPDAERQAAIIDAVTAFEQLIKDIQADYNKKSEKLVKTEYVEITLDDEIEV